jgi:PadR family transcriptional regulator
MHYVSGREGDHTMPKAIDLVHGTFDMLILKTVAHDPKHGSAIAKRIHQVSKDELQVQQGSLYPALHRLEQQEWIKAEWRTSETGRGAKFYSLTRAGRKHMEKELENWDRLSKAINVVVNANAVAR